MTPSAAIVIRPAVSADIPDLGRLAAMLVALHHAFDPERFISPTPRTAQGYGAYLGSQVGKADTVVLVAEAADRVVGYAYASLEGNDYMALRGPAGVLQDILVDPEHRGENIGRQLLAATMDRLVELGAPRIVLFTAERNTGAQRLFEAAGFRPTMIEMTWEPGGVGGP